MKYSFLCVLIQVRVDLKESTGFESCKIKLDTTSIGKYVSTEHYKHGQIQYLHAVTSENMK